MIPGLALLSWTILLGIFPPKTATVTPLFDVRDWFEMTDVLKTEAASVAYMADPTDLKPNPLRIDTLPFCFDCPGFPAEPIVIQPARRRCTAFLVDDDRVVTAGHCVENLNQNACGRDKPLTNVRFVFGFLMLDANTPAAPSSTEILTANKVIDCKWTPDSEDWAVILLQTKTRRRPLPLASSGTPAQGTPVRYIGHPLGLPLKESNGTVERAYDPGDNLGAIFATTLKSGNGASGSPVLDANGEVVGVLRGSYSRPGTKRECRNLTPCAWPNECVPTFVTRTEQFSKTALP